jgi:ectoine hydroxylase-related dioxygenase (phytanoyl-CoA dioxygenase family)
LTNTLNPTAPARSRSVAEQFESDGYLVVRSLFAADEVEVLASEAKTLLERTELIDTANLRCRWQTDTVTGDCHFDCFDPVTDIGPVSRWFALHPRLLACLRDVYGDEPRLLKDKLIFKRPGAGGYALHQDYIGWDDFPTSFVTAIVAVDATTRENGATEIFPGAHRRGYLSPHDGDYHELSPDALGDAPGVLLELEPGDVALFGGFMPHRSGVNRTGQWRRQLYLSYNADRDGGDRRAAHYRQFEAWLRRKYAQHGRTNVYFR